MACLLSYIRMGRIGLAKTTAFIQAAWPKLPNDDLHLQTPRAPSQCIVGVKNCDRADRVTGNRLLSHGRWIGSVLA